MRRDGAFLLLVLGLIASGCARDVAVTDRSRTVAPAIAATGNAPDGSKVAEDAASEAAEPRTPPSELGPRMAVPSPAAAIASAAVDDSASAGMPLVREMPAVTPPGMASEPMARSSPATVEPREAALAAPASQAAAYVDGRLADGNTAGHTVPPVIRLSSPFPNGALVYTLDGSRPTPQSGLYTGPFAVSNSVTLRALAYSADFSQTQELGPYAVRVLPTHALTALTSGGGRVELEPPGPYYPKLQQVRATAKPDAGWVFLGWEGDATGEEPVALLTMDGPKSITGWFGTTIGINKPGNGSVVIRPDPGPHPYGTAVEVEAQPDPGYAFALWGNAASGRENPMEFLVTNAAPVISALFVPLLAGQYTVNVQSLGGGTVVISPRKSVYGTGEFVLLRAVPDAACSFQGWQGDATGNETALLLEVYRNLNLAARFVQHPRLAMGRTAPDADSGQSVLELQGTVGSNLVIEVSTNLVQWVPAASLTLSAEQVRFPVPDDPAVPWRFFRAVLAP